MSAKKPRAKKTAPTAHLVAEETRDAGREARKEVPRSSHSEWSPASNRDPIAILEAQSAGRIQELVPIRYGRMSDSAFTFYRGGAAIMAADLAPTPATGIVVQSCGDAHISNFGGFASPDRKLVFGLNDFDETLPGSWEWDVKRMAASAEIAARDVGAGSKAASRIVKAGVDRYRDAMRMCANASYLEVWYGRIDFDEMITQMGKRTGQKVDADRSRIEAKATRKTSERALKKLTHEVDGKLRFISDPPIITPIEEIAGGVGGVDAELAEEYVLSLIDTYAESLPDDRRHLFQHYKYVHMARKVVGVGSVGTRCWVVLFMSHRRGDPLVLQVKEADISVLAPYAGPSKYDNQGQRVVEGQRLTQAASDIFLGWLRATGADQLEHDFYLRQLWDWKFSADLSTMDETRLVEYSNACGAALALAHARSGDRVAIASYLGKGDAFSNALVEFSKTYADQNEIDHQNFLDAIASGRLVAQTGV